MCQVHTYFLVLKRAWLRIYIYFWVKKLLEIIPSLQQDILPHKDEPIFSPGITRRWVFGKALCWLLGIIYWLPQKVEFSTIMVVSLHRIYNLLFPLSTRGLKTARSTRKLCALIWLIISAALCLDIYLRLPVKFDEYSMGCSVYGFVGNASNQALVYLWLLTMILLLMLPLTTTLISNLAILVVATYYRFQHTGKAIPSKNAFVTVTLVAWGFLFSVIPAVLVYAIMVMYGQAVLPRLVVMIGWECLSINIWINPIIYTIINSRFRAFVSDLFSTGLKNIRGKVAAV